MSRRKKGEKVHFPWSFPPASAEQRSASKERFNHLKPATTLRLGALNHEIVALLRDLRGLDAFGQSEEEQDFLHHMRVLCLAAAESELPATEQPRVAAVLRAEGPVRALEELDPLAKLVREALREEES